MKNIITLYIHTYINTEENYKTIVSTITRNVLQIQSYIINVIYMNK